MLRQLKTEWRNFLSKFQSKDTIVINVFTLIMQKDYKKYEYASGICHVLSTMYREGSITYHEKEVVYKYIDIQLKSGTYYPRAASDGVFLYKPYIWDVRFAWMTEQINELKLGLNE